ncbi:glucose 1-dehydrogenase [Streptomyces sp. W16]|uniref:glucose 1-dehydrogenase n=1 Tax=Streptomyces sp. W16 TaxID=3076631 RepID=UPI00295A67A1|nr:glucose 1-dehydrogenase [Streptomyces sp. W16]MDV9172112.1 glucose 1-dehydrogenase [Streptomyces sp. W16]
MSAPSLKTLLYGEQRLATLDRLDAALSWGGGFGGPSADTPADRDRRTYVRLAALVGSEGGSLALVRDRERMLTVLEWAAVADPAVFHTAMVHLGVCTATILELGCPGPYLDGLTGELDRLDTTGTILITERGRGGSHLDPGTEAVWHPSSRTFTLHTPEPGAAKIMGNVAAPGIPKAALVYAQLVTDGRRRGVFPFALRLRTTTGPTPGVRIRPLPEVPALPLDYAEVTFDGARVPYDGWLRDSASFTGDGHFTDPLTDPAARLVRSTVFSANATLCSAVGLAAAARAAVTAALRYARSRTTSSGMAPGQPVLAHRTQQEALYSALADAWACSLLAERARSGAGTTAPAPAHGPTWAPWVSVHRDSALAKAAVTDALARVTATCRTRSGAWGVIAANRLTGYEGLAQIYQAAAGDNLLIRLEAGRSLVEDAAYRPAPSSRDASGDLADPRTTLALATAREAALLEGLRERLDEAAADAEPFQVWNPLLPDAVRLVDAHLDVRTLDAFDEAVRSAGGQSRETGETLRALRVLYALNRVDQGRLTPGQTAQLPTVRDTALARVHDRLDSLLDAFAVTPARLGSPMAEPDSVGPAATKEHTMNAGSDDSTFSLRGRTALVTGASRGIGRAIALALARAGADVAVLARSTEALRETAAEIERTGRKSLVLTCDVAREAQILGCVDRAITHFDGIDILVNNAAALEHVAPFLDLTHTEWCRSFQVNVESTAHFCRAVGAHMVSRGSGVVLNISSIAGLGGFPMLSPYAAGKAAMNSLTRTLAAEWASAGVRVNGICPGWVVTEMTDGFSTSADLSDGLMRAVPAGRWGDPEDIAGAAVYLASDAARLVTGACLVLDGGATSTLGGPTMRELVGRGRIRG